MEYKNSLRNAAENGPSRDTNVIANFDGKPVHPPIPCSDTASDLRLRGALIIPNQDAYSSGIIKPFPKPRLSFISSFSREMKVVAADQRSRRIFLLGIVNIVCSCLLIVCCHSTNSMALTAYTYLTFFDFMVLLSCLLSFWVEQQTPTSFFTFGYERFEVLAVFGSTILAQLGSFFIIKESIERILVLPELNMNHFLMGTVIAFLCHLTITYGTNNKSWNHVISAAASSWLQEHVADMSQSICHVIPGLSRFLLPRVNPLMLIAFTGSIALFLTHLLIEVNSYEIADPVAAIGIALMTCGTMFPMSVYSGKILLQTAPSHIVGQLDKCLREASTLDGVLEFRNEHFWTLSFGLLVGSLHVRIRRDANEQLVLAHLMDRLSNLVSILTIQVFKDDWKRGTTFQLINDMAKLPAMPLLPLSTDNTTAAKHAESIQRPITTNYSTHLQQSFTNTYVYAGHSASDRMRPGPSSVQNVDRNTMPTVTRSNPYTPNSDINSR